MTTLEILAQVSAGIALLFTIISMQMKEKKKMMLFGVVEILFTATQFFLLKAYTGVISSFIALGRNITILKFENNKKNNRILFIIFEIIIILFAIFTWKDIKSLLPLLAASLFTFLVFNFKDTKKIRYGSIAVFIIWFIYKILVKSYVGAVADIILIVNSVVGIIRLDKNKSHSN